MKRNIFAIAIAAGTALTLSNAFADSGTINFTGEIIQTGCDVEGSTQGPVSVDLGKISKTDFNGAVGTTTAPKEFTIALTNCPADLTASVRFDGAKDASDSSLLALSEGSAQGVAIALKNADMTPLSLNQDSTETALNADGTAQLKFYAQYQSTADEIVAGPANSVANFTVAYK